MPSALVSLLVLTAATIALGLNVRTVGDMGELPTSMLTETIVADMTDTSSNRYRECVGQGVANIATGVLGGMAGSAPTS